MNVDGKKERLEILEKDSMIDGVERLKNWEDVESKIHEENLRYLI